MTLTDEQVVTTRNDVEMLKRRHLWPQQRYVCLKAGRERRGDDNNRQFGHLFPNPDGSFVVRPFMGFSYTYTDETLRYADAEAVVDDGWVVD